MSALCKAKSVFAIHAPTFMGWKKKFAASGPALEKLPLTKPSHRPWPCHKPD